MMRARKNPVDLIKEFKEERDRKKSSLLANPQEASTKREAALTALAALHDREKKPGK